MNQSKYGFMDKIEKETLENTDYRRVVYTGKMQLVYMSIKPGNDIGAEIHDDHDQFFRFEAGKGRVIINEEEFEVGDGDAVVIPAGANHNVINTSTTEDLKLYTIYAPPEHPSDRVQHEKPEIE